MKKLLLIVVLGLLIFSSVTYFLFIRDGKVILACKMIENKMAYFAYDKNIFYWEWNGGSLTWEKSIKYTKDEKNSFIIDHDPDDGEKLNKEMDLILKVKKKVPSIEYTLRGETVDNPRPCKRISYRALKKI